MDQKDKRNEQEIKEAVGVKPDEKLTDNELDEASGGIEHEYQHEYNW